MDVLPVTLTGRSVELQPLALEHAEGLFEAQRDPEVFRYLPYAAFSSVEEAAIWVAGSLERQANGIDLPFAIVDRVSSKVIGSTRYLDIATAHRHVEIGSTWLDSQFWRTSANTECKYLLLRHAFETLGCVRVQLKTDLRNERSQRAIERLGAVREGVLRKAVILPDGYQRSSVYYSIIDDEWPQVKANLEARLAART